MRKYLFLLFLLCLHISTQAQINYRYWFDNDESTMKEGTSNVNQWRIDVDVSSLSDNVHFIQFQVADKEGALSSPVTRYFYKSSKAEGTRTLRCVCSIDGELKKQEDVANKNGVLNWNLDVADLPLGLHHIQVRVMTLDGAGPSVYNSFFLRSMTAAEQASLKYIYRIDEGEYEAMNVSNSDLFHFNLDVAGIEDGLHRITYMLTGENGVVSPASSAFFWKTPLGGNGVTGYSYWLNDQTEKHEVKLEQRPNPFDLITLVPVDKMPIRSSCFDFKVENGAPVLYAKNDIHFEFVDASGSVSYVNAQYVDGSVKKNVSVSKALAEEVGQETFSKPESDAIQWYSMDCENGDSIAVQLSQAASVQIFAPSGKEVYNASGAESIVMNGIHARENGTYYLAIHDVTASQSEMTLDYQLIDKYAVLDYDVHTVGNGGYTTITFNGNGFDELESVSLQKGSVVLKAMEIGHESDASTSAMFDFTNVSLGQYKAVFTFKGETKTIENCVTVEQAKDIEITLTSSFASTYLSSTNNTYTFRLTNHGNNTAYNVPVALHVYSPTKDDLQYVKVSNFDSKTKLKELLGEKYTRAIEDSINALYKTSGDLYYLLSDDDIAFIDGFPHLDHAIIPVNLRPNETETVTVAMRSTNMAYVYLWHPEAWEPTVAQQGAKRVAQRKASGNVYGCAMSSVQANACEQNRRLIENGLDPIYTNVDCPPIEPSDDCPHGGGASTPVNSMDPNDIYGYLSESGSKYIAEKVVTIPYRIEFENDPDFATASAHKVTVTNVLDAAKFNLSSYTPTSIKIGDKDVQLNGDKQFVTTVDMRPSIDAIAQVEGTYDEKKGIATWKFTSLDPMTMEETDDVMQGFLPINHDGNGIGEVAFSIDRLANLADGADINNKATIVFDSNDAIETPVWTNTIDAIAPTSKVTNVEMKEDSKFSIHFDGEDARSGIWKYDVYYRWTDDMDWIRIANGCDSTAFDKEAVAGYVYQFCVVATDMAGNVEPKSLTPEFMFSGVFGDVNGDGKVTVSDAVKLIDHSNADSGKKVPLAVWDVNNDGSIDLQDAVEIIKIYLNNGKTQETKSRNDEDVYEQ